MLSFLPANYRGQNRKSSLGGRLQNPFNDLLARLGRDGTIAFRTMSLTDASKQHTQKVVDLGYGANRRARIGARGFLGNGNRWAQTADVVDIGFGHLTEKLPRKCRKTLDVSPLPFGKKSIECQRTLP